METNQSVTTQNSNGNLTVEKLTLKQLFNRDDVKNKFQEMLGKRAPQFITSVLQIAASNDLLAKAEPVSIYNSAMVAATLDLPINQNLGFAYIIPYNVKQSDGSYMPKAQFQMGYKGFKQLALRSGQFMTINDTDVREGELKSYNRLTGEIVFDWIQDDKERLSKKIIGYVSYFALLNGFSKTFYMTIAELEKHGLKFSQTYKKGFGLWKDDFDSMAKKTVTKLNLSKNAPLSVEMQKAIIADQAIINDADATDVTYADNEEPKVDKLEERATLLLSDAKLDIETCSELSQVKTIEEKYSDLKDVKEFKDAVNAKKIAIGKALKGATA